MFEDEGRAVSPLEGVFADLAWIPVPEVGAPGVEDDEEVEPDESDVRLALVSVRRAVRIEWPDAAPSPRDLPGNTADAARSVQADLLESDRVVRLADVRRIADLLRAFEVSMADLTARFGAEVGSRNGAGARAFFASIGLRMSLHPKRVAHLVDAATVAERDLPRTWAVFQAGGTTWSRLDIAVQQMDGLDLRHRPAYDRVAAEAIGADTRVKRTLRRARERLQDDTAAPRARTTHQRRAVDLEPGPDGAATLSATGLAPRLVGIDQALTRLAVAAHGVAGETATVTQLRHDLFCSALEAGLGLIAQSGGSGPGVPRQVRPEVRLVLTVPALAWLGRTTEQAVLGGYGPIDLETAKQLAGTATSMLRVLTDPVTGVRLTMDRTVYAPPADLRRWVRIRDGRSRFPGGTRPAWLCDLDHAREWQDGGPTAEWNLVALSRPEHLAKSLGLWQEELRRDGIVRWQGPWGEVFDDPPDGAMDPAPPELRPPEPPDEDPPC